MTQRNLSSSLLMTSSTIAIFHWPLTAFEYWTRTISPTSRFLCSVCHFGRATMFGNTYIIHLFQKQLTMYIVVSAFVVWIFLEWTLRGLACCSTKQMIIWRRYVDSSGEEGWLPIERSFRRPAASNTSLQLAKRHDNFPNWCSNCFLNRFYPWFSCTIRPLAIWGSKFSLRFVWIPILIDFHPIQVLSNVSQFIRCSHQLRAWHTVDHCWPLLANHVSWWNVLGLAGIHL